MSPVGTPTPVNGEFPDDNMRAIRFFRQQWDPSWEFNANEDLLLNKVSPTVWNTNNPHLPVRVVPGSGEPLDPTSIVAAPQIRPYYFDPDCPPVGQTDVLYGGDRSGHGAWLSFDTMRLDYGMGNYSTTVSIAGTGNPYWAVPADGYLVGIIYGWDPYWGGGIPNTNLPLNEGLKIMVNGDSNRTLTLPLRETADTDPGPELVFFEARERLSFYMWTNAYDMVQLNQVIWDAAGGTNEPGQDFFVSMFWKETRPAVSSELPHDVGTPS